MALHIVTLWFPTSHHFLHVPSSTIFSSTILIRRFHLQFPAFANLDFCSMPDTGPEGSPNTYFWFVEFFFYYVMARAPTSLL